MHFSNLGCHFSKKFRLKPHINQQKLKKKIPTLVPKKVSHINPNIPIEINQDIAILTGNRLKINYYIPHSYPLKGAVMYILAPKVWP